MSIKHYFISTLVILVFFSIVTTSYADSGLSRYEIKYLLRHKIDALKAIASKPEIINAVIHNNEKQISFDKIADIDSQWNSFSIDHPQKKRMYSSNAGVILKAQVEANSSDYSEIFVTDNQGANVAAWPVTSDYWQGDEAKWRRSFNNGSGKIYIGNIEFDESSQSTSIQISVPVMHKDRTIGVLIGGIKLSELQARYLMKLQR